MLNTRGLDSGATSGKHHLRSTQSLNQYTLIYVDAGHSNDVCVGRRIERRRSRSVIADRRDDDIAAHDERGHGLLEHRILWTYQAHVDYRHAFTRHPSKCSDNGIDGT